MLFLLVRFIVFYFSLLFFRIILPYLEEISPVFGAQLRAACCFDRGNFRSFCSPAFFRYRTEAVSFAGLRVVVVVNLVCLPYRLLRCRYR